MTAAQVATLLEEERARRDELPRTLLCDAAALLQAALIEARSRSSRLNLFFRLGLSLAIDALEIYRLRHAGERR